ncbi:MAG: zinc ABC transporter substrate-binding protein [Phycisphaerales bacterium]|nr:zinc ABC transporter substrate-binding protein [Phycisphaerales bacterium]
MSASVLRFIACLMLLATAVPAMAGLKIVATTGMVGDVAAQIGGEHATVTTLCGEGVDPHLYTPRASDVRRIMAADLVLYNGLMLEGRMDEVFKRAAEQGKLVRPVAEVLKKEILLADPEHEGHPDPHVWMDVRAWMQVADGITKSMCEADPANCAAYQANAKVYKRKLDVLDNFVRNSLRSVPRNRRVLVTAHDAFSYFGRAYNIEVIGVQGISTESEAGLADVNGLVDILVEQKIPAVFVESSVSDKYVRALIEGAAARGHTVTVGGELFSDAMGKPGTREGTYMGMMAHNGETITKALGGIVPFVAGVNDHDATGH